MMRREGARVVIDIENVEFGQLTLCLGYAIGAARRNGAMDLARQWLILANAINEGNPRWTPYQVDPSTETALDAKAEPLSGR
jgi:hypothetical protein